MAKILLVEDDNNLREIYEARLQAEGYDIVAAKDGEEALVVAKKEQPDLIISDVMMPRISGFEMLDILRNTEGLKQVKVIMLTALGQAEDKTRADSLGADRYLVKSQVTLEDIVKAAGDLLNPAPANAPADTTAVAPAAEAPAAAAPVTAPVAPAPTPEAVPVAVAPAPAEPAAAPAVPTPVAVTPAPTVPVAAAPAEPAAVPTPVPAPAAPLISPVPVPPVIPAPAEPVTPPAPAATPTPPMPFTMPAPSTPVAVPTPPAIAPAPAEPTPTLPAPVPQPAPVTPAPEAAPEVTPPAPTEPATQAAPAPDAASATSDVTAAAPQDASEEKAAVQAQIDQFAAAPAAPAPAVAPATEANSDDAMMADAVKDLMSGTAPAQGNTPAAPTTISPTNPAPAPATATPVDPASAAAPAPAPAAPTPAPAEDDSVTISKKKIIQPIMAPADATTTPNDIHALLAKEGMKLDDPAAAAAAPAAGAPQPHGVPGMAPMQHQPGHVISPTPTNSAGQPVDPNSISL